MNLVFLVVTLATIGTLLYSRAARQTFVTALGVLAIFGIVLDSVSGWLTVPVIVVFTALAALGMDSLRYRYISEPMLRWFKRTLPALSSTEQAALDAGTVWWDAELFSGVPNWRKLLTHPAPRLTPEEQAFIEGPVQTLCAMLDSWQIELDRDLPEEVWAFLKRERFFGLIIDKAYGGLGFSPFANSEIVMQIATRDAAAAVTVMVPNSLGPGELLQHYGTAAQKEYYLPRLASGEDLPCFALTSPVAGSDAGSMADTGVVCYGDWQGERVLGFRLNWDKRYITLAPVASLLGLAFKAYDPDGLLGDTTELGITCALVASDLPGVTTGQRHLPSGASFMNGPTQGKDVFIPLDAVIGGAERIGEGWTMLVQSLAAGRAISLPAMGVAGTKLAAHASGAYARVRKQFKMPIGYFEGVEEVLARLAGNAYRDDATRRLTLTGLMAGERPSVLTAIAKAYLTESNRRAINDAMDIHGGKGVMQGPRNYLQTAYRILPIGITVEGANILTRSMIVFGQGAIRAHPHILNEMQSARLDDPEVALQRFDSALFAHVGFTLSNFARTLVMSLTGARFVGAPVNGPTAHYYRQLTRMSSAFALIADLVLMVLGGNFKFREKISGRLADVLAHLYMATAVLKEFEDSGRPSEDLALVNWAMRDSLFVIQNRLINVIRNFPVWWMRRPLRAVMFPLGLFYREPSDNLGKRAARTLLAPSQTRERLMRGLYLTEDGLGLAELNTAFNAVTEAEQASRKLRAMTHRVVSPINYEALIEVAREMGDFSEEEGALVRRAQQAVGKVIQVDDFERDEIRGPVGATADTTVAKPPVQPAAPIVVDNGAAPGAARDDLTKINGIGPKYSAALTALGYTTFVQIAGLTDDEIGAIEAHLQAKGRINRDDWITQARDLV